MTEVADTAEDLDTVKFKALLRSVSFLAHGEKWCKGTGRAGIRNNTTQSPVDFLRFGFHVTMVPDGAVALSLIRRAQPNTAVILEAVESMSGFDLIWPVVSMEATGGIFVAALTRFNLNNLEILMFPEGVSVIQLGVNMDDHIAKTFSALEYRFL